MIAITPRTGSTFLCSALHEAGYSIEPGEVFNARGPAQMERDQRGTPGFAEYFASLTGVPDDNFIFKIGWYDAKQLAPVLTRIFPRLHVVYLERKNIAAQAVSQFRAEMSGLWHARPGEARPAGNLAGKFNLSHICEIIQLMGAEKRGWEGWFAASQITPLRLEYGLLETDVREALRRIAEATALHLRLDLVTGARVQKIADELSTDWTERVQKHLYNFS